MNKMIMGVVSTVLAANVYAATETTGATTSVVTPNEGTTLSVPASKVSAAKSKIKINYTAESTIDAAPANKGDWNGGNSLQHVGLKYDLGNDQSVQFRQYFGYNLTDATRNDEWQLGDQMFRFTDNKQITVGDMTVSGDTRFYIPGFKYNREIGVYGLRHDATVEQVFGKATLSYGLSARAYMYSEQNNGQTAVRMLPNATLEYKVAESFKPYLGVYTDNRWKHTGKGVSTLGPSAGKSKFSAVNSDVFYSDIGANFAIGKNIGINAYVETGKDLRNSKQDFNPLDAENNVYEVDLTVSM